MYKNYKSGKKHFGRKIKSFDPSFLISQKEIKAGEPSVVQSIPVPQNKFSDFNLSSTLKNNIEHKGYKNPTPIQDKTIPLILSEKDIVGIADTGTGKTAAFLLPLINKVVLDKRQKVLIVAPTRELAVQIERELYSFTKGLNIFSAVLIGGVSIGGQIKKLKQNPHFVIGTPGRILDLENQKRLNLGLYQSVVLDEVDRMLDMGFVRDVEKIISKLPEVRQSLFFSATINPKVEVIIKKFTQNPETIKIDSIDKLQNIKEEVIKVRGRDKMETLCKLLRKPEFYKVIVFGRTKRGVDKIALSLNKYGIRAETIHGNKSQGQRQRALDNFKKGKCNVLVATDVASRGIDVSNVSHVVNYDLPETQEEYTHRIGRTGRADKKGVAISFV